MIEALINPSSKVNTMLPNLARKLGFRICKCDIGAQKIDESRLKIFGMVIVFFLIDDKDEKSCFFKEIISLANISINVALGISFFTLSNVKVNFTN